MNQRSRNDANIAKRTARMIDRNKGRISVAALVTALLLLIVGGIIAPFGDWLESIRFAGPALMIAVALVLLDAISRDNKVGPEPMMATRFGELRPFFLEACRRRELDVFFTGYSGETLYSLLDDCFGQIRDGGTGVEAITIRLLLPDCSIPMPIPCRRDDLTDYPPYRHLSEERSEEYVEKIRKGVQRLIQDKIIKVGAVEVRYHRLPPIIKLYVLNDETVFWGPYPIEESEFREDDGTSTAVYDLKGRRSPLFGSRISGRGEQDAEVVRALTRWVDVVWNTVSVTEEERSRLAAQ